MEKEDLRKVQLIQLEMLKEVARICDMHKIDYWLTGGTQLGAVRHNGFIPWDDDLDIAMLRVNYEKFLSIASKELNTKYYLQEWKLDEKYGLPFTKIRKKDTLFVEAASKNTRSHKGIYIDIFVYDKYPKNKDELKNVKYYMEKVFRLVLMKYSYSPWATDKGINLRKWMLYLPLRLLALFKNGIAMKQAYIKAVTVANTSNSNLVFNSCEPSGICHPIDIDIVTHLMKHKFEDGEFLIPVRYDDYLKNYYGNYMKLPPENQRENRHGIIKLKF